MEFNGPLTLSAILIFILVTIEANQGSKYFFLWKPICNFDSCPKQVLKFSEDDLTSYVLTENEYKYNMGHGYVFFEVLEPEELSYTYKLNPAAFSVPWNKTYGETNLVLGKDLKKNGRKRVKDFSMK